MCAAAALILAACGRNVPSYGEPPPDLVTADPNATATATPFQPGATVEAVVQEIIQTEVAGWTDTPAVTETSTPEPASPTPTEAPATAATAPPSNNAPSGSRALYTLYTTLDYDGHAAAINETVRYTNNTGQSLSSVVMSVEPNQWPGCFSLAELSQDGNALGNYDLDGHRLTIPLGRPLVPGETTTFFLGYSLDLPWKSEEGTFGYRTNQLNLTNWYPFIVPFEGDWVLHDPSTYGEYLVYDAADFEVNIKLEDPGVVLAASAPGEANGDGTRYHLEGARTFVLSASDSYEMDETAVGPVLIRAYYFPGHENANDAVVWMATQSIGLYQAKFADYPYQSLTIVESDLNDGQEFDGLVFLASDFYTEYNGTARSNLVSIGTHEIAHQWWFGLVGSDQASEPWLDEALSVYSEHLFYEFNHPGYGDWWWNFRVNFFGPSGYVDQGVYGFGTFRGYVNAVYLNGANLLDELHRRVGDEAFYAFLKDYAQSYARSRATGGDFFSVLRRHTSQDFSDIMGTYLQGQY